MRQNLRRSLLLFSMLLFTVTMNFLSPFVIINASFEGVIAGSFLFFLLLFFSSLVIGRAFCGWFCPAGGIQEACFPLKNKKVRGKITLIKYFIWVPWVAAIILAAVTAGGYHQINALYFTDSGISVDSVYKLIIYVFIIVLFFVLSVTVGKRATCHTICWMAPFMVIGKRISVLLHIPGLKLEVDKGRCTNCNLCDSRCPMSLPINAIVQKGSMYNDDCILCGECVDICPKKVISFSFGINKSTDNKKPSTSCKNQNDFGA
jgi:ferredoxin-type protein NapH